MPSSKDNLEVFLQLRDGMTSPLRNAQGQVRRFSRVSRAGFRGVGAAITKLKRLLVGIGAAFAAAFTVRKIAGLIKSVADAGDAVQKFSIRTGLSTEFLSEMQFAAERSGIAVNTLNMGLQRATRRLGQISATGTGEALPALRLLGGGLEEAVLAGAQLEELLPRIADQFDLMTDAGEKTFVLQKLFDSEGVALGQLLAEGSEGIRKLRKEFEDYGGTISQLEADEAAKFNDSLTNLSAAINGLIRRIIVPALPVLTRFIDHLKELIKDNRKAIQNFFAGIIESIADFLPAFATATEQVIDIIATLSATAKGFVGFFIPSELDAATRSLKEQSTILLDMVNSGKRGTREYDIQLLLVERIQDRIARLREQQERQTESTAASTISWREGLNEVVETLKEVARRMREVKDEVPTSPLLGPEILVPEMFGRYPGFRERGGVGILAPEDWDPGSRRPEIPQGDPFVWGRAEQERRRRAGELTGPEGIGRGLRELRDRWTDTFEQMRETTVALGSSLENNLGTFFEEAAKNPKKIGEAFSAMTKSIIADLLKIAARLAASRLLGALFFGGQQYGATGLLGRFAPTPAPSSAVQVQAPIPGAQTGGFVSRTGLAQIHRGEFIVNPERGQGLVAEGGGTTNIFMYVETTDADSFQNKFRQAASADSEMLSTTVIEKAVDIPKLRGLMRRV